ncbi:TPA: hypothetical protein ACH3X1_012889 [Trebouxia sp. C0004]
MPMTWNTFKANVDVRSVLWTRGNWLLPVYTFTNLKCSHFPRQHQRICTSLHQYGTRSCSLLCVRSCIATKPGAAMHVPQHNRVQATIDSIDGMEGLQSQYRKNGADTQQHTYGMDGVNDNYLERMSEDSVLQSGILRTASGNDILRSQHAVDAAEQGEAGYQDPIVYSHEWEHAIYEGRKVPEDHRKHVQLHGFGGTPGHPWLITGATGTDDRGQQFHWNSRRHRKGRSPAHKIPPPPHSAFRPLAWVDPRPFLISPKKLISWLSPILTMLGSTLFAINNASQASNHVQPWTMEPYQGHRLYDWIAATLAFAGLWVVLPGQYLKWVETLNTDYDMRIHNREQAGKKGHKPRLRFVGFRPQQVSYWGVLLRVLGAAVFVLAATDNWLNQTCHGYMKRIVEKQEVFQEAPVHMVNQDTVDSVDSAFVQLLQSMAA